MSDLKQRLWDLVRYQRHELFTADLISQEEYTELAKDHAAVERLETLDGMRQRIAELEAERDSETRWAKHYSDELDKVRREFGLKETNGRG